MNELRLGWALLVVLTGFAVIPETGGSRLFAVCVALGLPGSLLLARAASARTLRSAFAAMLGTGRGRALALVVAGLLTAVALIFSPSAAFCLALALGSLLLAALARRGDSGGLRVLDQVAALGGALLLVLIPLELALRLPPVARQFGLPGERRRQVERYDRLWERNVFHFRSPHETVSRRAGVRRVVVLGDSFSWGLLVPDSDSIWPARLERGLEPGTEVVNMAQRGWTTANEAEFLRRVGWQFDPDLVIVQFYLNDAYESAVNLRFEEGRRAYLLPEQFWRGYVRESALSALVSIGVNGALYGYLLRDRETAGRYDSTQTGWRQMQAAFREMGDSARARRTPLLLVLFPDLTAGSWTRETYPARALHRRVSEVASAAGFEILDLTEAFAAAGGDWKRWWAAPYDSHPNEGGHAIAADAITRYLRERAW